MTQRLLLWLCLTFLLVPLPRASHSQSLGPQIDQLLESYYSGTYDLVIDQALITSSQSGWQPSFRQTPVIDQVQRLRTQLESDRRALTQLEATATRTVSALQAARAQSSDAQLRLQATQAQITILEDKITKLETVAAQWEAARQTTTRQAYEARLVLRALGREAAADKRDQYLARENQLWTGQWQALEWLLGEESMADIIERERRAQWARASARASLAAVGNIRANLEQAEIRQSLYAQRVTQLESQLTTARAELQQALTTQNQTVTASRQTTQQLESRLAAQSQQLTTQQATTRQTAQQLTEAETTVDTTGQDVPTDIRLAAVGQFVPPVAGPAPLTATFRDPTYAADFGVDHNGLDIALTVGTPVLASRDGIVQEVKADGTDYNLTLQHADDWFTVYGHLSETFVLPGDLITAGTPVGRSGGAGGGHSTGPHLHFEVIHQGLYLDPLQVLTGFDYSLAGPDALVPSLATPPTPTLDAPADDSTPQSGGVTSASSPADTFPEIDLPFYD